jgi:predicted DNA-binding transcriptional regulator AlpA
MASPAANPDSTSHPRILHLPEVMQRLGCSRSSVYRLTKAGILPQAEPLKYCSDAGWHEDVVDAVVESRRPAGKKPAIRVAVGPARAIKPGEPPKTAEKESTSARCAQIGPCNSGMDKPTKPTQDLVPTTLRMMGNVVYYHAPTRRLFMEVGKLASLGRGSKLGLNDIAELEG